MKNEKQNNTNSPAKIRQDIRILRALENGRKVNGTCGEVFQTLRSIEGTRSERVIAIARAFDFSAEDVYWAAQRGDFGFRMNSALIKRYAAERGEEI